MQRMRSVSTHTHTHIQLDGTQAPALHLCVAKWYFHRWNWIYATDAGAEQKTNSGKTINGLLPSYCGHCNSFAKQHIFGFAPTYRSPLDSAALFSSGILQHCSALFLPAQCYRCWISVLLLAGLLAPLAMWGCSGGFGSECAAVIVSPPLFLCFTFPRVSLQHAVPVPRMASNRFLLSRFFRFTASTLWILIWIGYCGAGRERYTSPPFCPLWAYNDGRVLWMNCKERATNCAIPAW